MLRNIFTNYRKHFIHIFILGSLLIQCKTLFAQIDGDDRKYLSIGPKNHGIGFGNTYDYNGIRLNLWDTHSQNINGFNFSFVLNNQRVNGIQMATFATVSNHVNGLSVGSLYLSSGTVNGVATSLFIVCDTINGLVIAHVAGKSKGKTPSVLNGLDIGIYSGFENVKGVSIAIATKAEHFKGVSIGLQNDANEMHGIQIGIINKTQKLKGVQFGLINVAMSNPFWARRLPFINIRLPRS